MVRWANPEESVPVDPRSALIVSKRANMANQVLVVEGLLNSGTYRGLRDRIIKAVLDEPHTVIVDVTALTVPAESALAVFTSAYWHIPQWLPVPFVLVCAEPSGRAAIVRNGITRYVPVYPTLEAAVGALSRSGVQPPRRRARANLPPIESSVARSRELVAEWLADWSQCEFIPVAKMVATAFVENVLRHTDSAPVLRLESTGREVWISVGDNSTVQAGRHEDLTGDSLAVAGLAIVAALTRRWGNAPTPTGKTVWAVVGPENRM